MSQSKRGRPRGPSKKYAQADAAALSKAADVRIKSPGTSVTAALNQQGGHSESDIRRLTRRWRYEGTTFMAEARSREQARAQRPARPGHANLWPGTEVNAALSGVLAMNDQISKTLEQLKITPIPEVLGATWSKMNVDYPAMKVVRDLALRELQVTKVIREFARQDSHMKAMVKDLLKQQDHLSISVADLARFKKAGE